MLEVKVILAVAVLWVPFIPKGMMPLLAEPVSWRFWLFQQTHETFFNPHRPASETFQLLRRLGYWETLATDLDRWYAQCAVCQQYRSHPVPAPARSVLADDALTVVLPWHDVIIDCQGPFTKAEGGEQNVLSYHCVRLKVPLLAVMPRLQAGPFSRALSPLGWGTECLK